MLVDRSKRPILVTRWSPRLACWMHGPSSMHGHATKLENCKLSTAEASAALAEYDWARRFQLYRDGGKQQ